MVELFIKLIEKGIELLKERERSRKRFFDEVVVPLHDCFRQLATEHMETFARLHDRLSDDAPDVAALARVIQRNELLEKGSVQLLSRLIADAKKANVPNTTLADPFQKYLNSASSCLLAPDARLKRWVAGLQPSPPVVSIAYYIEMATGFRKHLHTGADISELRETVDAVIVGFQVFRAEVESNFLALKAACLR